MPRSRLLLALTTVAVLQCGVPTFAQPTPSPNTITPDAAIQNEMARAAAATSDAELQSSLTRLRAMGGPDFDALIPQLVLFLMNASDVRAAMIPGVIIDRLQISPAQLRQALAPYRGTADVRLRDQIDNVLQGAGATPPPEGASSP